MATPTEEQAPTSLPDGIDRTASGGSNVSSFSQKKRFDLADLLRDCAVLVEQNEMDQKVFQRMFRELTEYVSGHGAGPPADASSAPSRRSSNATAASHQPFDEPDEEPQAPPAQPASSRNMDQPTGSASQAHSQQPRKVTKTTTTHIPPPSGRDSARNLRGTNAHDELSKEKNIKFFDKIKSAAKEAGEEFTHIAHTGKHAISQAAKKATSAKNAQRAREDLANEFGDDPRSSRAASSGSERYQGGQSDSSQARPANPNKPPFQRPVNPNSTLIANGWLEQQRRSKMRFVWKEVLVSLVAGRRPGEETTLWVQRETTNPVTGSTGLEALHQIPIKGMQDVNYVDFSTDHRFVIQVYNLSDEFVFRTRDTGEAAKNWVSTLRLTREAVLNGVPPPKPGDLQSQRTKTHPAYAEDEKKAESPPQQQQQQPRKMAVKELRAIAHAHGVNTAGMERQQLEAAVAKIQHQNGGQKAAPREDESERGARARQVRRDEEAAARLAAEESSRAEAERRRAAEAEEMRRRQQHADYLRQQEMLRQQQAQQQAQAQAAAQQRAAEQQRYQQQQQYYAQQQAQAAAQQQYYAQQQAQAAAQQQQQYFAQQQAQQQQYQQQAQPPPHGAPPPGAQQPHGNPNKWANIIAGDDEKEESDGQAAITAIKHHILIQWALQPPTMQVLRPIPGLLTTVHNVFPPTQGVPAHDYFKKWKTVSMESLSDESGKPDENKLAKAVKKLRFFLHPDKLPRDLTEEQTFVCKMLWDVTSDAWEEHEKQKEQLDWLNQS